MDFLAENMVLKSLFRGKLVCRLLRTFGRHHTSSMEACTYGHHGFTLYWHWVGLFPSLKHLCGSENGYIDIVVSSKRGEITILSRSDYRTRTAATTQATVYIQVCRQSVMTQWLKEENHHIMHQQSTTTTTMIQMSILLQKRLVNLKNMDILYTLLNVCAHLFMNYEMWLKIGF